MPGPNKELSEHYAFVDNQIAREGYVYEVLHVIETAQQAALKDPTLPLAALENLYESRVIKIPHTHARNKNINYLVELLLKNYPEEVRQVISFEFHIEKDTKKLTIDQKNEFTVKMGFDEHNKIQLARDKKSLASLERLLTSFRVFNLSKLLKKTKNKTQLTRLVKMEVGNTVFTFKNYSLDRNQFEVTEDFCFHQKNFDAVKEKIDITGLRAVVEIHSIPINRRLKKFGIINPDFSDYRDNKLDYILNILLHDIPSSLSPSELTDVKNFHSLRGCLQKVDKVVDPIHSYSNDIVKMIMSSGICKTSDILTVFEDLTDEMLEKWIVENSEKYKIMHYKDPFGTEFCINSKVYLPEFQNIEQLILNNPDKYNNMPSSARQEKSNFLELLVGLGRRLLASNDYGHTFFKFEDLQKVSDLVRAYDDYSRNQIMQQSMKDEELLTKHRRSPLVLFVDFIKSIFKSKKRPYSREHGASHGASHGGSHSTSGRHKGGRATSRETRELYSTIRAKSVPLIALSDLLELTPENELRVDNVIQEMRDNNLKIVIPIYNARTTVYPVRSQNILMPDVEYMLVDPEIVQDPERIRAFTDSLAGFKLKDEVLPPKGIMAIEKYLLTLNRQKKAQFLKRKSAH